MLLLLTQDQDIQADPATEVTLAVTFTLAGQTYELDLPLKVL